MLFYNHLALLAVHFLREAETEVLQSRFYFLQIVSNLIDFLLCRLSNNHWNFILIFERLTGTLVNCQRIYFNQFFVCFLQITLKNFKWHHQFLLGVFIAKLFTIIQRYYDAWFWFESVCLQHHYPWPIWSSLQP